NFQRPGQTMTGIKSAKTPLGELLKPAFSATHWARNLNVEVMPVKMQFLECRALAQSEVPA
ncbi:MAG: hypothetical protein AAB401_25540, partial [Acidobacteriota bacterium]